jgi:exopolysaccharide production protein ExoZ
VYGIALLFHSTNFPPIQFLGNPIILEFFLGVAINYAPNWRWGIWGIPAGAIWLLGAGLIGIVPPAAGEMSVLLGHDGFQRVLIFGIPSTLIVYGALQIKARENVWTYLGDASYSLYLSHMFILFLLFAFSKKVSMPADLIILTGISASLLFAWRIHERLEKPVRVFLKRQRLHHRRLDAIRLTD